MRSISDTPLSLRHPSSPFSPFEHTYRLIRICSYFSQLRLILRTKRHLRRFLCVPECVPFTRSRISSHLDFPRFIDDNSRSDDDKLQLSALMHRKCPPAGKFPDAENSRTLRSASSSLVDLRCCFDWQPLPVLRLKYS